MYRARFSPSSVSEGLRLVSPVLQCRARQSPSRKSSPSLFTLHSSRTQISVAHPFLMGDTALEIGHELGAASQHGEGARPTERPEERDDGDHETRDCTEGHFGERIGGYCFG